MIERAAAQRWSLGGAPCAIAPATNPDFDEADRRLITCLRDQVRAAIL